MMKRVAIIQRQIPHYRVPFFAEVQAQAARVGLQVTVYSIDSPGKREGVHFNCRVLPARYLRGSENGPCWINGLREAVKGSDIIVAPQELQCLNVPYLWAIRKTLCKHWIWWGHGYNFQYGVWPNRLFRVKEAAKRFMTRRSDGLITYAFNGAKYWQKLGMPNNRIAPFLNTIDVHGLRTAVDTVSEGELSDIRRKLELDGKRVLLFSGRLYPEKRVDFLLRAYAILQKARPDVALLILGEGPEKVYLEMLRDQLNLCHIHFLGEEVDPRRSGVYFRLSNLLVIPGLVGLAIVHGFAFGLPLVTTDHGYHSPEIEYLSPENGIMTAPVEAIYAQEIGAILNSPTRLTAMKKAALAKGDQLLLVDSTKRFVDGIRILSGDLA